MFVAMYNVVAMHIPCGTWNSFIRIVNDVISHREMPHATPNVRKQPSNCTEPSRVIHLVHEVSHFVDPANSVSISSFHLKKAGLEVENSIDDVPGHSLDAADLVMEKVYRGIGEQRAVADPRREKAGLG